MASRGEGEREQPSHARIAPFVTCDTAPADPSADLRAEWLRWMRERLPQAAAARPDWPIRLDHCFGRVILDAVYGRPWRQAIKAPAWRHMDAEALHQAVALASAIVDGRVDLKALNARSLDLRSAARRTGRNR